MTFVTRLAALLIVSIALCGSSIAQSRRTHDSQPPSVILAERQIKERLNAGTVGLAGGLLEGAPIRFATEIARVVNDGGAVHVLPIVTRGPTENVNDLLYLKGVDAAIINSDSLEEYSGRLSAIDLSIGRGPSDRAAVIVPRATRTLSAAARTSVFAREAHPNNPWLRRARCLANKPLQKDDSNLAALA